MSRTKQVEFIVGARQWNAFTRMHNCAAALASCNLSALDPPSSTKQSLTSHEVTVDWSFKILSNWPKLGRKGPQPLIPSRAVLAARAIDLPHSHASDNPV
ncbi:hypothetical protein BJ912DRAFT_1141176 [Pholiota molesta]|nr:hypothetical protein BJ912DRAFT_1141176 [Pholiota molesta]